MKAKPPYVLGSKVLIDRVAAELGWSVKRLAPYLVRWHQQGRIRLARIDLVAAFDTVKASLARSYIPLDASNPSGVQGWHAIDRDGFS